MTNFYLLPIETVKNTRGPKYLKWRYADGLSGKWSLKDFGNDIDIGLVATGRTINKNDALLLDWSGKNKDQIKSYLKNSGIDSKWVLNADNRREGLHRLAGLTQAMQSNKDNPDNWLEKDIHFGFTSLESIKKFNQVVTQDIPYLKVQDNFNQKKINLSALLHTLLLLPFAALPATDAFTASDGTPLTTYSANWTYNVGTFQIFSNAVVHASGGIEGGAFWNADTPNTDHYVLATVQNLTSGQYIGLSVRNGAGGVHSFYDYISDSGDGSYLGKYVTGTYTQLGSTGAVFTASLAIRLEVSGSNIRPMRAGATADIGIQTDSALSNTRFGIAGYDTGTLSRIDNWEGGNLTAATKAKPIFQRHVNRVWYKRF